ncbi:hypothetical protein KJ763_00030, partial [Patescibacteria group bacterium]|nr:hypothetical protein [Patescibacteria group bacterium]
EEVQKLVIKKSIEPGITRAFLAFEEKYHMLFVEAIRKVVKERGKSIHPNEAAKIIRKIAEEKGILPTRNKRGKEKKSHTELVAGSVISNLNNLEKSLKELQEIDDEKINAMRFPHPLELETKLMIVKERIAETLKKLKLVD